MSSLRRANAALLPCRRGHKGGFIAGEATAVPERDGSSVARGDLAPPDRRARHTGIIKRESLAGRAEQLKQENFIPPRMHARPSRKAEKAVPAIADDAADVSRERHARPLGHFMANCPKPDSVQLSHAKPQKTVKAANALVIDLTTDSY